MKKTTSSLLLLLMVTLAGCASGLSGGAWKVSLSPEHYASFDCDQLAAERERILDADTFEWEYQQRQLNEERAARSRSAGAIAVGARPSSWYLLVNTDAVRAEYLHAYQTVQRVAGDKRCPDIPQPLSYWQILESRQRLRSVLP